MALVTGASRGIGRAIALRCAREGADVVINYAHRDDAAQTVAEAVRTIGRRALVIRADVQIRGQVEAMVMTTEREWGRIDILVNNAAVLVFGNALTMSVDALETAMRINVQSLLHCVQCVAPLMTARRSGRIINIAATSALGTSVKGIAPHVTAKAGVVILTKTLAQELGAAGITVNAVLPGAIDTEITLPGGELHEALRPIRAAQLERTLLGRAGTADDVAAVVAFLASDDAAFMTAQALSVDGGRTDFLTHSG